MCPDLTYRSDYGDDVLARAALSALLRDIFELDLAPMERFSGWDPSYRSFSYFDADGLCVANVGAFAMPLRLNGRDVTAAGIQSVAVRPAWRGRGLFRELMRRTLAWTDGWAPLALLTTDSPALYRPFDFRLVPEQGFFGPPPSLAGRPEARPLDLESAADRALLRRLFQGRAPVSERFGLLDQAGMFPLMLREVAGAELHYLPSLEVAVATAADGGRWRLLDVVGAAIPPLGEILGALALRPDEVEVCFAPDKLAWPGQPRPLPDKIGFMARGPFLGSGKAFALPPTAAF